MYFRVDHDSLFINLIIYPVSGGLHQTLKFPGEQLHFYARQFVAGAGEKNEKDFVRIRCK